MTKTEQTPENTEHDDVTVRVKIPRPLYDALMIYFNSHPYYEDFSDFLLEAIREQNLSRIIRQEQ